MPDRRLWLRIAASVPLFAVGGLLLLSYGVSLLIFPMDREFFLVGLQFELAPALFLFSVGILVVGWQRRWRTLAWLLTLLGAGTLGIVGCLWVLFRLPFVVGMLPEADRAATLDLVRRMTGRGAVAAACFLQVGATMLLIQRSRRGKGDAR
jgi:hypothetical protein